MVEDSTSEGVSRRAGRNEVLQTWSESRFSPENQAYINTAAEGSWILCFNYITIIVVRQRTFLVLESKSLMISKEAETSLPTPDINITVLFIVGSLLHMWVHSAHLLYRRRWYENKYYNHYFDISKCFWTSPVVSILLPILNNKESKLQKDAKSAY